MRSYESKSKRRKPEIVALRRDNSNEDAFKRSVITWASTNGCPHLLFQVYNIVVGEENSASDDDDASNSARIDAIVVKSEQGGDGPLAADQEAMSEANAKTATASSSSSSSSADPSVWSTKKLGKPKEPDTSVHLYTISPWSVGSVILK